MKFVAIDFETANAKRTSACSIGLAYVENGQVVRSISHLIRPEPFYFEPINISIHGITEDMVKNAPSFGEIWELVAPEIEGYTLVAHNAAFDMSVIRNCLDFEDIPYPNLTYLCTLILSKNLLPNEGCYRLDYLSYKYQIPLDHHDAESDAVACANLMLLLARDMNVSRMEDLFEVDTVKPGQLFSSKYKQGYSPCRSCSAVTKLKPEMLTSDCIHEDEDFTGKHFAFTGALSSMPRESAVEIVIMCGGIVDKTVTGKTNYLISGIQNPIAIKGKPMSSKMAKAIIAAQNGQDIQLLQEDDFLSMIDDDFWEKYHKRAN